MRGLRVCPTGEACIPRYHHNSTTTLPPHYHHKIISRLRNACSLKIKYLRLCLDHSGIELWNIGIMRSHFNAEGNDIACSPWIDDAIGP